MSESLYRKYRPQVFDDVVGQDHIIKTLQSSVEGDKVAHAYLFCGPRGTGKTTTARILAKALLCEHGPTPSPDGVCEDCKLISESVHPDVFELDAASRTGVDNVREEIISRVGYAPVRGKYKVYIIDEVHMLSKGAFNALLKTLEEPPSHVVFILCTTDPQKVLETIRSRCQRFDFRPIITDELTGRLGAVCEMEGVEYEGDALDLIARRSNGGLRDALTSLEQSIAFGGGKVTLEVAQDMFGKSSSSDIAELVESIGRSDIKRCLEFINDKVDDGLDFAQFIDDFAVRIRDIYVMKLSGCEVALESSPDEILNIKEETKLFSEERLLYILSILHDLVKDLRTANNQRLTLELGCFKLVDQDMSLSLESLNSRISDLEGKITHISSGGSVSEQVSAVPRGVDGQSAFSSSVDASSVSVASATEKDFNFSNSSTSDSVSSSATVSSNENASSSFNSNDVIERVVGQPEDTTSALTTHAASADTLASTSSTIVAHQVTKVSGANVDFRAIWMAVKEDLKVSAPQIFGLLDSTHGRFNRERKTITLNIESGRTFAYDNLCKPAVKNRIISALEKEGLAGATIDVHLLEKGEEEKPSSELVRPVATDSSCEDNPSPAETGFSAEVSQPQFSAQDEKDEQLRDAGIKMNATTDADFGSPATDNAEPSLSFAQDYHEEASLNCVKGERNEVSEPPEASGGSSEILAQSETIDETKDSLQVDNSKSEIDALNEILASTFGEGAEFHEI